MRGIEGHVVSHCFKPLVTRFVEALKEIRENMVSRVITANKTYYTCLEFVGSILRSKATDDVC